MIDIDFNTLPVSYTPPKKSRLTPEENAFYYRKRNGKKLDTTILHMDESMVKKYCGLYRVSFDFVPILQRLNKANWYVFSGKDWKDGQVTLVTGFYTGTGIGKKRLDITPVIERACILSGFKTEFKNVAPRGGAHGNRLIIKK